MNKTYLQYYMTLLKLQFVKATNKNSDKNWVITSGVEIENVK